MSAKPYLDPNVIGRFMACKTELARMKLQEGMIVDEMKVLEAMIRAYMVESRTGSIILSDTTQITCKRMVKQVAKKKEDKKAELLRIVSNNYAHAEKVWNCCMENKVEKASIVVLVEARQDPGQIVTIDNINK